MDDDPLHIIVTGVQKVVEQVEVPRAGWRAVDTVLSGLTVEVTVRAVVRDEGEYRRWEAALGKRLAVVD